MVRTSLCHGCGKLTPRRALLHGRRAGKPRCEACRWATRRAATLVGSDVCRKRKHQRCFAVLGDQEDEVWTCQSCIRTAAVPTGTVTTRYHGADPIKVLSLCKRFMAVEVVIHVDVWIIAVTPSCALILFRMIVRRRHGCFAGLLPAADMDEPGMAEHIGGLYTRSGGARWPMGSSTPIIIARATAAQLDALRKELRRAGVLPESEIARLRSCGGETLSNEHSGVKGFRSKPFQLKPRLRKWSKGAVVRRSDAFVRIKGVPARKGQPLGDPSDKTARGKAWNSTLLL
eukprot:gene25639-23679_t